MQRVEENVKTTKKITCIEFRRIITMIKISHPIASTPTHAL